MGQDEEADEEGAAKEMATVPTVFPSKKQRSLVKALGKEYVDPKQPSLGIIGFHSRNNRLAGNQLSSLRDQTIEEEAEHSSSGSTESPRRRRRGRGFQI